MTAFIPPPALLAALMGALVLPVLLIALSHPPFKVERPGWRFRLAVLGMTAVWLMLLGLLPGVKPVLEILCGALILPTAVLVGFSFWSLLAHGFTISMLLSLAEAGTPLTLEGWMGAYGGAGLQAFARDRMQVLFGLGMVVATPDGLVQATRRGVVTGRVAAVGLALFNIDPQGAA